MIILPKEIELILKANPRAFAARIDGVAGECENCGGSGVLMVYELGEYHKTPVGKVKWFDLPSSDNPNTPALSGWYEYTMHIRACPVCREGRYREWLIENCGLGEVDRLSLTSFRTDTPSTRDKDKAKRVISALLAKGGDASGFVTLYGGNGVGKSHLLKAAVWGFVNQTIRAEYYNLTDMIAHIAVRYQTAGSVDVERVIAEYRTVKVLAIDEVDKIKLTDWAKQTIFRLLDSRYNDSPFLLTMLALNVQPNDYEMGYLTSRMSGGVFVEVGGADIRPVQGYKAEQALLKGVDDGGQPAGI